MKILSIKNINRSVFSTKKSTALASKSIENISNILKNKTSSRKKISDKIIKYKNRRLQSQLRQEQQDELYASSIVKSTGGPRLLSLSQVGGSFLNKIIKFIGYTAAGWILSNIPTWISAGKIFYSRMISLGSILKEFTFNVGKLISDIGFISNAFYKNMVNFDFFDTNYRIRNSLDDLNSTLDNMGEQIKEAFDIITEPFTNVTPLGSEGTPGAYPDYQPEEQEEQSQFPQSSQSSQPSLSGKNADFWTLVAVASREDSDPQGQADVAQSIYNRVAAGVFPGGKDIKKVILARKQYQPTRQYPKENPSGDTNPEWYQITDAESAAKATGYEVDTIRSVAKNITNPTLQKKAAEYIENRTDFLGRGLTPKRDSSTELRRRTPRNNIFGNFVGPGSFEYGRRTVGKSSPSVVQSSSTTSTTPQNTEQVKPSTQQKTNLDLNKLGFSVGEKAGYSSSRGRIHSGRDIAIAFGTPVYTISDATITDVGIDRRGYGYYVAYVDSQGIEHFYGHLREMSKAKKGQKLSAGTVIGYVGSTGRSTGPHLHWEVSPRIGEVGRPRKNVIDPIEYGFSSSAPFRTSSQSTPSTPLPLLSSSPTSQTTQVTNEVQIQSNELDSKTLSAILKYADIEKKQKIIFINDLQTTSPQEPTYSKDRGESLFGVTSQVGVLNTFIKHKFLLDLNYL